jgi:hypothetical protein
MADANVPGKVTVNGLEVGGDLDMRRLTCGGVVECRTWSPADQTLASVTPAFRGAADFSGSALGTLVFEGTACGSGPDLSLATVGRLEIRKSVCESPNLEGLEFRELLLPAKLKPIELLKKADPFRLSTWARFEKWLRERGEDKQADKVYIEMRRRNRRFGMGWLDRWKDRLLDWFVGYGLASHRLAWLLLIMLATMSMLLWANPAAVVPKDPKVNQPSSSATHGMRFWVAFRTVVPVVTVFSGDDWKPSPVPIEVGRHRATWGNGWALRYDQLASMLSAISWILVPLFVAGITGWLRKR